jgi:hypothetical protein
VKFAPSVVLLALTIGCSSGTSPARPPTSPGPGGGSPDAAPSGPPPTTTTPDAGGQPQPPAQDAGLAPSPDGPAADTRPPVASDGPVPADTAPVDGATAPIDIPLPPPLMACPGPSIDRIEQWVSWSGDSTPTPMTSILVKNGATYIGKVEFRGADWHEVTVRLINSATEQTDLTGSMGFWLTYSATADLWVQLRGANKYNGGDKWVTKIPATGGTMVTTFFSFAPASWFYLNVLGVPTTPLGDALKTARAFNFVGNAANVVTFTGLRVDKLTPPCRGATL